MKLAFPNGESEDFTVGKGSFSIGSTEQDDVVIANGVGGHAILTVDQRGITLSVDDLPAESVAVNGRPVLRRAILRPGDRIDIGGTLMVLRGEELDTSTPPHPFAAIDEDGEPARILIRGLSGSYAGRVFPIGDAVHIGTGEDADIRVDAGSDVKLAVGYAGERLFLRHEGGDGLLDINGHEVRHAELSPGDQIVVGEERLLVEAPGLVPGSVYVNEQRPGQTSTTQVFQAISMDDRPTPRSQPAASVSEESEPSAPVKADLPDPGRWDAVIISVCAVLSVAMIAWLYLTL